MVASFAPEALDPNIPALSHLTDDKVCDLTGRVKRMGKPATFSGNYSTVYQGNLDGNKMVCVVFY